MGYPSYTIDCFANQPIMLDYDTPLILAINRTFDLSFLFMLARFRELVLATNSCVVL